MTHALFSLLARPRGLLAAAVFAASPLAHAVTDPAHDFLSTFGGSTASADLDVLSASVTFDAASQSFTLRSTMDGAIGSTAGSLYVWGVNRGAGTAGFGASLGLNGVLFDRVVLLTGTGTGSIGGGGALPTGAVTISGNTITAVVAASLLPSTGFAPQNYTWNLWPRDTKVAGLGAISDFAPDNANLLTVSAVPEPQSMAMMLAGLGALGWVGRRRRRAAAAPMARALA